MLDIMSSLTNLTRIEYTASAWLLASGVTGTWVKLSGDNAARPSSGDYAFPVFTESSRTNAVGSFTPDVTATGKVTVLYGKLHARTDQFTGTPVAGDKLSVSANGVLQVEAGSGNIVAVCTRASATFSKLNKNYTVIEYVTV